MTTMPMPTPSPMLAAAVYYTSPAFVQQLTDLLAEHAGVRLEDPNALWGEAHVDGMHVEMITDVTPGDLAWLERDSRINATWQTMVEPVVANQQSHVIVQMKQITDPFAAQEVFNRILMVLTRVHSGANALHMPDAQLATTGVLYLHDWEMSNEERHTRTWFNTIAAWEDDSHTTSAAYTRGLPVMGVPDVHFIGVPREPAEARNLVRNVVGALLAQQTPPRPRLTVHLGPAPFTFLPDPDPLTGTPGLILVPASVADGLPDGALDGIASQDSTPDRTTHWTTH